ncbi:MAG: hypothetical protein AAF368_02770 [Planctomycetota bacterium]
MLLFLLSPLFALAGLSLLFVLLLLTNKDMANAYPSPERHERVKRLPAASISVSVAATGPEELPGLEEERDFDGDGVADRLSIEFFQMEPLFTPVTSGMVLIHSGATGALLLAHAVPSPLDFPKWCGDVDGNGTEDVFLPRDKGTGAPVVLAFETP